MAMQITSIDQMEYASDAEAQVAYVTSSDADIPGAESETVDYYNRVIDDGGVIVSIDDIDAAINHAKTNSYWSSIKAWYSAQFGYKTSGSGVVTKLYSITGSNDIISVSGTPHWTADQQNGKASIIFDGIDDYMSTPNMSMSQPVHLITVFNQITYTQDDYLFDGLSFPTCIFGQDATGGVNNLYMYAGAHGCDSHDLGLNTYGIASLFFSGSNSKLQINENTIRTGSIGTASPGGITIGAGAGNAYNRCGNMALCDLIIFNSDQTSIWPDIRTFLNLQWGIY